MPKKILIVDDEPLIVKGLKYSLEQDGYETDSAQDGEEAVNKFFAGQYDLVLLDVMLPKLDGIEVCQRIREKSNVPIIMLTAKGDDMDKILGLEYGADDYMTKPFNILEVKARIKGIFRRTAHDAEGKHAARHHRARYADQLKQPLGGHRRARGQSDGQGIRPFAAVRHQPRQGLLAARTCWRRSGSTTTWAICARWTCTSAACARRSSACPASPNISSPSGVWAIISLTRTKVKEFLYSIRWKILIAYLLIISIAFSVVAATLIQLVGDYMFNQRVRDDQRVAENLSSIMSEALFSLDVSAMLASAADASSEGLSRVLVLDRYGVVQVDAYSQLNGRRFENAEVANVLDRRRARTTAFTTPRTPAPTSSPGSLTSLTGVRAMTGLYAAPIYYDAELIGVLVYISQAQEIYENLSSLRSQMLLWMLLVAASALIISMFVVRTITRPIGELSAGISRMSRGDLSSPRGGAGQKRVRPTGQRLQLHVRAAGKAGYVAQPVRLQRLP